MAGLGQNRVYDIGQIEILKSTAVRLLDTGIDSCREWDRVVSELKSLQAQTPIKSSQLSSGLDEISGKFYQADYEVDKCWVKGALDNVITNIPQQDITGVVLLETLNLNLQYVMTMIEDLSGCIEVTGPYLKLAEFEERVESIKRDWEETSLEKKMEEAETLLLGMPSNVTFLYGFEDGGGQFDYLKKNDSLGSIMERFLDGITDDMVRNIWVEKILTADDSSENLNNDDVEDVLICPKPGDTITISRGIDLPDEEGVVFSRNTWSREYSVNGCNSKYAGQLCCRRLNHAIENYECNSDADDLLMFNLNGYDEPIFAGAMVEGFADIGDIVEVTLDDGNSFNFLILDVKSTKHTSEDLAPNNQCQCEWGHGYVIDEGDNTVQLSVCEFITAGSCAESNVQNTESGAFLKNRSVAKAQIIDHIQICD